MFLSYGREPSRYWDISSSEFNGEISLRSASNTSMYMIILNSKEIESNENDSQVTRDQSCRMIIVFLFSWQIRLQNKTRFTKKMFIVWIRWCCWSQPFHFCHGNGGLYITFGINYMIHVTWRTLGFPCILTTETNK